VEGPLNKEQERFLLSLARNAISHYLETGKTLHIDPKDSTLREKRGAFVSLKVDDQLRGCIGYPLPSNPLVETIIESAIAAATRDLRFLPLTADELSRTRIEISVLSVPWRIEKVSEIEVGRHGIIVSKGKNKGLLLPQVPVEWNWDRETYLRHGCLKAGLDEEEWKKGASVEVFTAQVFSE